MPSSKPRLYACGEAELRNETLASAVKRLGIRHGSQYATVLAADAYQMLIVQPPDVPQSERKSAMKWRLKELIDYPVEEACYDVLNVPLPQNATVWDHMVFAITARRDTLATLVARLDAARVRVSAIDVPEIAQRNIAALYEDDERGTALLYLDDAGALFTLTFRGELYLARRFEITGTQLREAQGEQREEICNRILLEVQRTLDNFERQFGFVAISKLMVGPEPEDTGLRQYFSANLETPVVAVDLSDAIDVDPAIDFGARTQWRMFHLVGCALRPPLTVQ